MVKSTSEDPTEKITKVTPLGAGSVDRKNAGLLMLAPRSGQSDSKKASKVSFGLEAVEWRAHRRDLCQRPFFHGEIRVQIRIRGLYAFVPQP